MRYYYLIIAFITPYSLLVNTTKGTLANPLNLNIFIPTMVMNIEYYYATQMPDFSPHTNSMIVDIILNIHKAYKNGDKHV